MTNFSRIVYFKNHLSFLTRNFEFNRLLWLDHFKSEIQFFIDEFFFIRVRPCESNTSEAIRDIDPNSFVRPSLRLGLLHRSSFDGHG